MIRQKKKYSRPQRPFDKARIDEENILREKYGLKNKKEIWKADASIGRIRNLAKQLITASEEDKNAFIERMKARGFEVKNIAEVLALDKEDWLKRRLQTILLIKGLTTTPKQARQLIAHKHVSIGNQIVNVPSYMVTLTEENLVKLNIVLKVNQKISKEEEIKKEILDEEQTDEEFAEESKGDDKANEGNSEEPSESEEVVDEVAESEDTGSSNEENVDQSSDEVKEDKAVEQNEEVKE
ncbi:MAG TPA: 30S ribosomal protein S4 [Candidatus Pacearchaeota archaeon]|jgi:small subunit ribosomal protein S4|nr:30S ribosomal protein S4 [Candidatus Pacearchaeota archaeon]|tara:strand:+ start:36 stop:752 length:717 start_codon:yes stop_codon:yes gene_type:complete